MNRWKKISIEVITKALEDPNVKRIENIDKNSPISLATSIRSGREVIGLTRFGERRFGK